MSGPVSRDRPAGGLAVVLGLVFGVTFLAAPRTGGGWFWDFGNGLGFLALGGLLYQMIPPARARSGRGHEYLGYWVLGTAILHAFWFLGGDGTVRFYLLPGASIHVWPGLIALVALAVLAVLARMPDRMRVHPRFRTFRQVHRALAFLAVGTGFLHVVLSGFYLAGRAQVLLLALLTLAACLGRPDPVRNHAVSPPRGRAYVLMGAVLVAGFVLIRNPWP